MRGGWREHMSAKKGKGLAVAVATVAAAGTIVAPALANETATTTNEQGAQTGSQDHPNHATEHGAERGR
jgi:hypothetical protein